VLSIVPERADEVMNQIASDTLSTELRHSVFGNAGRIRTCDRRIKMDSDSAVGRCFPVFQQMTDEVVTQSIAAFYH